MAYEPTFAPGAMDAESENLRRRYALAQELQKPLSNPQGGQMVGNYFVANPYQVFADVYRAYKGREQEDALMQEAKDLQATRQQQMADALSTYGKMYSGTPEQQFAGPAPEGAPQEGGYIQAGVAPNPQGANAFAMNSQNPMLQQLVFHGFQKDIDTQAAQQATRQLNQMWEAAGRDPNKAVQMGMPVQTAKHFAELGGDVTKDLLIRGPDGALIPNQALISAKQSIQRAGAPQLKVDVKAGEGIAAQIGPMLKDSAAKADAAVQMYSNSQDVLDTLANGKAFTGTGANVRLSAAQIADTLGIGGASTKEKIANTRSLVQSLSNIELDGAGAMKGQGQITENERALIKRAKSGDISFTPQELQTLANANQRYAKWTIEQHNQKLGGLKNIQGAEHLGSFYTPVEMPKAKEPVQRQIVKTGTINGRRVVQYSDGSTAYAD